MRVIAGTARGMRIKSPKGRELRPTLDRVREALFNILGDRVENSRFLDLFAGTGANGIEALSRGAAHAVFAEHDPKILENIRTNLNSLHFEENATCMRLELPKDLGKIPGRFDVIFADPPYAFASYGDLLLEIEKANLINADALLCIEHDKRTKMPEKAGTLLLSRQKSYGDTSLSFYEMVDESNGNSLSN